MSVLSKIQAQMGSFGLKQVRRIVVFVVGMTVLLLGVALLVLPGPAILVIPAGLAILSLEFRWARRWMRKAKTLLKSGETRFFRKDSGQTSPSEARRGDSSLNKQVVGESIPPSPRQAEGKVESLVN